MSFSGNPAAPKGIDDAGSAVAGTPGRHLTPMQKIGVAGLLLGVFLAFIWINQLNKVANERKQPDMPMSAGGGFVAPPPSPPLVAPPASLPMPVAAPAPLFFAPGGHEATAAESPIFAFSGGIAPAAAPALPLPATLASRPPEEPGAGQSSALSNMLRPTILTGSRARLLPHPDMMVTLGTIIPCTLQTAIDSQLAGFVKCVLPQDVRGTTGNVVLLDRGTTVVGEIGHGLVQGQDRVFVLWDRAETPDHVVIELSSPGTDELGRPGLPGRVNNHWWERFGSAILLSVIQGGLQTGTALASGSGSGGGAVFNSFGANGSNVSDTALQATIAIPPTLEKDQGSNVAIFVAKDLDFSDVYNLSVTGAEHGQ